MNKKKRLIVLLALMALTACSANKNENFTQDQSSPTITENTSPIITESEITLCSASAKDGYYEINQYFDGGSSLTYWDYANGKNIFLCPNPNCSHDTNTCPSFFLTRQTRPCLAEFWW